MTTAADQAYYDALQGLPSAAGAGGGVSGSPAVGDIVQVAGGITGIVMSIIAGIALIQREDGQREEQTAAQVIVIPAPPTNGETDWMPIVMIGGLGLALVLMMGMRR